MEMEEHRELYFKGAYHFITDLLEKDEADLRSAVVAESNRGAANLALITGYEHVIDYIHNLQHRMFEPAVIQHTHIVAAPPEPEELPVSEPEKDQETLEHEQLIELRAEVEVLRKLVFNPAGRSQAGPTIVLDRSDGSVREVSANPDIHPVSEYPDMDEFTADERPEDSVDE